MLPEMKVNKEISRATTPAAEVVQMTLEIKDRIEKWKRNSSTRTLLVEKDRKEKHTEQQRFQQKWLRCH